MLAVADGTVVFTQDGVPEQSPTALIPADKQADIGGNKVILKIAPKVFAVYEHLQPGSLTVKVGDHVKAGALLAELGNTGPSTGPGDENALRRGGQVLVVDEWRMLVCFGAAHGYLLVA